MFFYPALDPLILELCMKSFACGDVVPGCNASWLLETDEEILAAVAQHAEDVHAMNHLPAELVESVRAAVLIV